MLEFKDLPEVNSERWLSLEELPGEVWKDIEGYEGKYQISWYGRVKSLERMRSNGRGVCKVAERILKLTCLKTHSGYWYVTLITKKVKHKKHNIHRLVAEHFVPNPQKFSCVNHKDENTKNNIFLNLEWCTYAYNNEYGTARQRAQETRLRKGISKTVGKFDSSGVLECVFQSLGNAAKTIGIDKSILSDYCRKNKKYKDGYLYRYI